MNRVHHFVLALSLAFCTVVRAQVPTGTPPFSSFGGSPDVISLADLNAHLDIPILHKLGRGTNFTYDLSYDTSVWFPVTSGSTTSWQAATNWGWLAQSSALTGSVPIRNVTGSCFQTNPTTGLRIKVNYSITLYTGYEDPFGTFHPALVTTTSGAPNCDTPVNPVYTGTQQAVDGSGYILTINETSNNPRVLVSGPTGVNLANPGTSTATVTDTNGNQLTTATGTTTTFTDTLGFIAITVAGSGTPSSPMTYTYTAPSGATPSYTAKYSAYTVQTNFGCNGVAEYGPTSNNLVSEIDLPDGSKYIFAYEGTPGVSGNTTGRLASVTLPTGGTISYSYLGGSNGISCADGSAATLTRTTPDGSWTYAQVKGSGAASTTTVTDPQGNVTQIQFQGIYETQRVVYQGSTAGTLLRTLNTCYNGAASPCTTTAITLPMTQVTVLDQYGSVQCKHVHLFNSFGLPTETDDYDYGSGAPGALLRKVAITYAALGNNINGSPQAVTVYNGAGTQVAQTKYNYDETGVTATSGTPQHTSVSGSRGNLTSINYPISGLTVRFTYYDTGTMNTATDVNGAATTNNYPNVTSTCGNAFPTSASEPMNLSRSMTWNCTGGVQLTATDENGQVTTTAYTDPYFWRPSSTTDATGAQTNLTYNGQNAVEAALIFNSGNSASDVFASFDGLGRVHLRQTRQAPGSVNFDTVETDYDALGRASRVTLPYVGTAGQTNSSAPGTSTTYDALSRPSLITDAGGGSTTYGYPQNDVTVTIGPAPSGENTKSRQLEYDALGRLTSVCEITGASGSGACGQNSAQTGFWTKYTHDALGNLTGVTQNGQVNANCSQQQSRCYSYDAMSRLTSENNPESGVTSYVYDSDSTCGTAIGSRVKRIDAVGNTVCATYDALGRATSMTYGGPYASNTPNRYLVYDSATVNGAAMVNVKNRLAEAYTATSQTGTKITDEGFSYSPRGELTDVYQLTPHSSSYYHVGQTYWPHGAPFQLSSNIGLPTIQYGGTIGSTAGLDGEGRITQVSASSGQNPVTGVTFNSGSLPSQVNFGSGDIDIFGYDSSTSRMTQYQFQVNGQSDTGTLTWNANSTLQKLGIADALNSANNQTCNYGYDDLARLTTANCGSAAAQTFSFDAFGNINKSGSPYSFQPTYSASTNRMTSVPGFTPTYDNNGNVTNDNNHTYAWDADGNSVTIDGVGLTFDALDRVVEKNNSGTYTEIVYAPTGAKLALMGGTNLQTAFVSLPGQAQAVYTSSGLSYYRHADWLGSHRLSSTAAVGSGSAPGTGSATVNGSEQSTQASATPGTGSVSFSGNLQSKQVQTQTATQATGSVTISGTERSKQLHCPLNCTTFYDQGTLYITVNNHSDSASYADGDTSSSVASNLVTAINGDSAAFVTATLNGSIVNLKSKASGSSTNYTLTTSYQNTSGGLFTGTSFTPTPSGSNLTGGQDPVYNTLYDSGTCTITVNSHGDFTSWSGSGTTPSSIASAIVSSINGDGGASVSASASGSTANLTARTTGAATNYTLSSSCTYDSSNFSSASFSSSNSASTLTGGRDAGPTTYDSGSVWVTVNSTQYSTTYGQTSTGSSLATALANAINGSSIVTATVSGTTVTLTATRSSAGTNYSLSSGSSTNQPSNFSQPSFTVSVSGPALTGGSGGTTMYADTAYAPFGEPYAQAGASDLSFTGQNQDAVSGEYDFPAREYSIQGRWPSPDPAGLGAVDPANPQSWNRYAYVLNNPLFFIDPLGLDTISIFGDGTCMENPNGPGWICSRGTGTDGATGLPLIYRPGANKGAGGIRSVVKNFIAAFPCNKKATDVINNMKSNFPSFANLVGDLGPFGAGTGIATFADTQITPGAQISINGTGIVPLPTLGPTPSLNYGTTSKDVSVTVTSVTSSSFSFTANPGHVLYPASISFSASNVSDGNLAFSIQVNGEMSGYFVNPLLYYMGGSDFENQIWSNVLSNLQRVCKQ